MYFRASAPAIAIPDNGISIEFPAEWLDVLESTRSLLLRILEHSAAAGGPVWHVSSIATVKAIKNES